MACCIGFCGVLLALMTHCTRQVLLMAVVYLALVKLTSCGSADLWGGGRQHFFFLAFCIHRLLLCGVHTLTGGIVGYVASRNHPWYVLS